MVRSRFGANPIEHFSHLSFDRSYKHASPLHGEHSHPPDMASTKSFLNQVCQRCLISLSTV